MANKAAKAPAKTTKKTAAKTTAEKVAKAAKKVAKAATKKVAKTTTKPPAKAAKTIAKPTTKSPAKAAKKSANKTIATSGSVDAFLAGLDPVRRDECTQLVAMMRKATGEAPKMWGASMVGFGTWHYTYDSGREGDMFLVGFSPRKTALTLYIVRGYENHGDLLAKLGKFTTGKSCLYLKHLDDVDRGVLAQLVARGVAEVVANARP